MKFCLIFGAVLATTMASTISMVNLRKLLSISKECQTEVGLSDADYENNTKNGQLENPKMKKHLLCICKKYNYISQTGDLNPDFLKAKVMAAHFTTQVLRNSNSSKGTLEPDEEARNELIRKCGVTKETPEETCSNLLHCLNDNKPSLNPFNIFDD